MRPKGPPEKENAIKYLLEIGMAGLAIYAGFTVVHQFRQAVDQTVWELQEANFASQ